MAPTGALEAFLKIHTPSSSAQFSASWVTIEDRARHYESFGDDYESCLKWYERSINSLGVEEEKEDMEKSEGKIGNGGRIVKETLMVAGLRDAVCGAERARGVMGRVVERGMLKVRRRFSSYLVSALLLGFVIRTDKGGRVVENCADGLVLN